MNIFATGANNSFSHNSLMETSNIKRETSYRTVDGV